MAILFELLDSVSRVAVEALLNSLWQGAVLAFLIWLLLKLFKQANATTRYGIWLATLLAVACLPFLNALASLRAPSTASLVLSSSLPLEPTTPLPITPIESLQTPVIVPADAKKPASTLESFETTMAAPVKAPELSSNNDLEMPLEPRSPQETFSIRLRGERWPQVFLIIWLLGIAAMMVRLIRSYLLLQRLKAASQPLAEKHQERMSHWLKTYKVGRAVSLRGSKDIAVPLMLGLRKTIILFPERLANDLAEDEFDQVLLHELAHVRRRDDWSNLLQKLIEALFFFHPVVRWSGRRLNAEREIACDQWVVAVTGARRSYASCLAKLFELTKRHDSTLLAAGVMPVKSHLSRRIETILKSKRNATPRLSFAGLLMTLCLLFVMLIQFGRVPAVIAFSASETSAGEHARGEESSSAFAKSELQFREAEINRWLNDEPSEVEVKGGVLLPSISNAMTQGQQESSGATIEALTPSTLHDGTRQPQRSLLEMVEASGNRSSYTMQPITFISSASNEPLELSSGMAQSSTNNSLAAQEPTASPAPLSSDANQLPANYFKAVAALGNPGSQREVLSTLLKQRGLTKANLIQALVTARSINSDGEKAELLVLAAGICTNDAEVLNAYFNAVSSIDSAGERRRVLSALLKLKGNDKGILTRILKAAPTINSDGEKAELLVKAASLYAIDKTTLSAFLNAVSSITSSAEQRRALTALLSQNNPGDETINQTVRFARCITSDGEKAEFLTRVAAVCPLSDSMLSAYIATASSIHSSAEKARALAAISKRQGITQATLPQTVSLARNNGERN
jgi:beta-lactamase regulating signal transducer with metallopeptidase domain